MRSPAVTPGSAAGSRARGHDGVAEADGLRRLALHPQRPRALEDAAPDHDLHLLRARHRRRGPCASLPTTRSAFHFRSGIERDPRRAELHAQLARALRLADDVGDVEQGLGRDAALVETGAAEAPVPRPRSASRARGRRSGTRRSSRRGRRRPPPRRPRARGRPSPWRGSGRLRGRAAAGRDSRAAPRCRRRSAPRRRRRPRGGRR